MKKKRVDPKTIILGIGLLLVVICGCILIFVDTVPKGREEKTPEPLLLQIEGWESEEIKTICLDVFQSYPEEWFGFFKETLIKLGFSLTPRQFVFPYEEILVEVLEQIDVQVLSEETQCDAVLTLDVTGTAKSSTYGNIVTKWGNSVCYAGSYVSGTLAISAENHELYSVRIRGSVSTPETIFSSSCPDQPYDAPFDESSAEALTGGLVEFWGLEIAEVIRNLYRTSYGSEEAMYDAADDLLKGGGEPGYPTVPPAEPATIETAEPRP